MTTKVTKSMIAAMSTGMFCLSVATAGFLAHGADQEKSGSVTVDHSKNPLTGTKKTVVHKKYAKKGVDGNDTTVDSKETTKVHTDGKVEHSVETDAESDSN